MSETISSQPASAAAPHDEMQTALFLDLVAQHANMALMFLGRVPHPQTGQQVQDLETARLFIDQLEMLEAKTKGNLNKREDGLLKQSLMATRMAFVEAIESQPSKPEAKTESASDSANPALEPAPSATSPAGATELSPKTEDASPSSADADDRKKFVKKY